MFYYSKNYQRGKHYLSGADDQVAEIPTPPPKTFSGMAVPKTIVGIVDFLNKTSAGMTARGVPMYYFYPLQAGWPPCIVSAKTNPRRNVLAVASFEHWEEKWPRSGIQRILGDVGDHAVEAAALLAAAGVGAAPVAAGALSTVGPKEPAAAAPPWDLVFNIDPAGCVDVDDVFLWRADGTLGMGIADVSAWVAEDSAADTYAKNLASTIYVDGTATTPMLPKEISESAASLHADGTPRHMLIAAWSPGATEPTWSLQTVAIRRAFTYEDAVGTAEVATVATALSAILGTPVDPADTHVLVERAMILYNHWAAKVLAAGGQGLLRVHSGIRATEYQTIAERSGVAEIAFLGSAAGRYCSVGCGAAASEGHAGLGLATYCHASSPLRRYADLLNQRWLKHFLFGATKPKESADLASWLNWRGQLLKQLDRDLYFLQNLKTDALSTAEAVVLKVGERGVRVYVPAWRRTVRAPIPEGGAPEIGAKVPLRAYCNLRATSWADRLVCTLS